MSDGCHALLIDDDRDLLRGVSLRLRTAGFTVSTAADAERGLDTAVKEAPGVIVLDIRMPGEDGLSLLSRLRKTEGVKDTPVVVVSASVEERIRERAFDLGARFFLSKPCRTKDLVCALETVTGLQSRAR